jgi:Right handed beta helix region
LKRLSMAISIAVFWLLLVAALTIQAARGSRNYESHGILIGANSPKGPSSDPAGSRAEIGPLDMLAQRLLFLDASGLPPAAKAMTSRLPQIQASNCAIQTAIEQCSGSCTVYVPAGKCALAASLDWEGTGKQINLECAGREVTTLAWPTGMRGIIPGSSSRIAHCTLEGPGVRSVGDSLINGSYEITDVVVEDNIIENSAEAGINTGGSALRWTIQNNLFRNNIGDGVFLASGTSDSIVSDNIVTNNGANGIDCNCSGTTIRGNVSKSNGVPGGPIDRNGILISGILGGASANYNSIVGNETSFNGGSGITIRADSGTYANYNVVSGNVSHDNGGTNENGDGIQLDGSDFGTWAGNAVVGNTVYNNQRFGIEVDGQNATGISTTLISSNTSAQNGNTGIFLSTANVTDTLVVNNIVVSNGNAQILDNGTIRAVIGGNKENTTDALYVVKGDLVANTVTSEGSNPIRIPNSQYIEAENVATNSPSILLGLDASDQTILRGGGGPKSVFIQTSSGAEGASMTDSGLWNFPGGMTIGHGISSDGSGLKHQFVLTGQLAPGTSAAVDLTWATPFADANYDPQCNVLDSTTGTAALRVHHIESITQYYVIVRVVNDDAANPHSGTLYCLGIHQ